MIEQQLKSFIDVAVNYFEKITPDGAIVKNPYIQFQDSVRLDFTGIIYISGSAEGLVYLTAPRPMLEDLAGVIGEEDSTEENLSDLIGEIANTISSNVRRDYGPSFQVSVPQVLAREMQFPHDLPPSFVLPIVWRSFDCFLVIALQEQSEPVE
jgi:chemotaxis protein CheX